MHTEGPVGHAALLDALNDRTQALVDALAAHDSCARPRRELLEFLRDKLIPHIDFEADTLYRRDDQSIGLLVQALEVQHYVINLLIDEIAASDDCMNIAVSASSLVAMCTARIQQEDHILLPALHRKAA